MKKLSSLIAVIYTLVSFNMTYGQSAYYDALKLRTYVVKKFRPVTNDTVLRFSVLDIDKDEKNDYESVAEILGYYTDSLGGHYNSILAIDSIFGRNPYLASLLVATAEEGRSIISRLISGVGSLDVTAFADGLAKFLVERTKEELDESFFRKFEAVLDRYPEFKTLFPNTTIFVSNFNSWEYSNLLNTMREAFDKDIKELLANIIKLKDLTSTACEAGVKDCQVRIEKLSRFLQSEKGRLVLSALHVGNGVIGGKKIPDIIDSLAQPQYLGNFPGSESVNVSNGIKLIDILSYSLRSNETGRHYISDDEFKTLLHDTALLKIYLGLVYQKILNANIQFQIGARLVSVVDYFKPENITNIRQYLTSLSGQTKNIQIAYETLQGHKLEGKADLGEDYGTLFETIQRALNALTNITAIDPRLVVSQKIGDLLNNSSKALQIAHDIAVRNYNAVVIGALRWLSDESVEVVDGTPESSISEFLSAFLKYGSFAANVVASKDPDDIKEAIKSFVLPSGSSSLKKHAQFSISVNAYVGFVYGHLNPQNSSFTVKNQAGLLDSVPLNGVNSIGVYAPLGIALNTGLGWRNRNPWSLSTFFSLIDIGSIVSYRFTTDTGQISNTFKVTLSNIFAPGGNIVLGLPNMPLSLGAGIQWIPTLQRDAKSNNFFNVDHSAVRYQIFVAVDLPLLNLHISRQSLLYVRSSKSGKKRKADR